ncbi:alpha/beta hydrolase [Labedella phragmitis]|uniref:Alpha/beta hydrolase n=1 Tax=Labedella phragmitis TaxID=2498849 RepID=A0A444PUM7_9MICO|nr:alpha/beta hydrolase [Labedella phragmitis]RWZ51567.1 alpha/beta hydrolase [Labedella phragmitis]
MSQSSQDVTTSDPRTPSGRVRRVLLRVLAGTAVVVVLVVVVFLAWANTVMAGDRTAALEVWRDDALTVTETDLSFVLEPVTAGRAEGLVFVPGARVDPFAYARVLSGVVERSGVTVVITKPTLHLALFDARPLSDFTAAVPGVDEWSVGGHSLGGVKACAMAAGDDSVPISGLVLFGSYCANDVSASGLDVLSISATNDGLSTPTDIETNADLLPDDATFVVLDGANHADFGDYGPQPGDGRSTVADDEVRSAITDALADFFP